MPSELFVFMISLTWNLFMMKNLLTLMNVSWSRSFDKEFKFLEYLIKVSL